MCQPQKFLLVPAAKVMQLLVADLEQKKLQVAANYTVRTSGRADYKRQYRPAPSPHFILCIFVLSSVTYPQLVCILSLFSHMFTFNKFSWTNETSNGNFQLKSSIQMVVLIFSCVNPFLHLCIFFSLSRNVMFNYACIIAQYKQAYLNA